jgi:hypothetical protein
MRLTLGIALIVLAQQNSCDSTPPKPAPVKVTVPKPPLHRFVLPRFPPDDGVAFDTQTGQICRTWDWSVTSPAKADADGHSQQRLVGEFAPLCISVYTSYPSGPGDNQVDDPQAADSK